MADKVKKSSSASNSKGVAIAKRAKIDSAQKNMLIAVGITSMLLGVTIVGVIYLTKKISFNSKIIDENNSVISDLKGTQQSLVGLSSAVSSLASNEKLEVVAQERSNTKCDQEALKEMKSDDGFYDLDDIEIVRTCTALRVIADALPSKKNQDATNSSINWLIIHDNEGVALEGLSGTDNLSDLSSLGDGTTNLKAIGSSISITDSATRVSKVISSIESSIRNYDIVSATISWSGYERSENDESIKYTAAYASYYSDKVGLQRNTKTICADNTSKKCASSTGSSGL